MVLASEAKLANTAANDLMKLYPITPHLTYKGRESASESVGCHRSAVGPFRPIRLHLSRNLSVLNLF